MNDEISDPTVLIARLKFVLDQVEKDALANKNYLLSQIAILEAKMVGHCSLDVERQHSIEDKFKGIEKTISTAIENREKTTEAVFSTIKDTIEETKIASDKRFEGVNEFRKALSDQTNTFLPRAEYTSRHDALGEKLTAVTSRMDRMEAVKTGSQEQRTKLNEVVPWIIAVLSFIGLCFSIGVAVLK